MRPLRCRRQKGLVHLAIYDVRGRLVRTLVDGVASAGKKLITWNGRDKSGKSVTSGVYFGRLTAGKETMSKKLVLIR